MPAIDRYPSQNLGLASPSVNASVVTPDDATELAYVTRGLYVGGAGALSVIMRDETEAVTFAGLPAGSVLPIRVKLVRATGTTATSIVAIW